MKQIYIMLGMLAAVAALAPFAGPFVILLLAHVLVLLVPVLVRLGEPNGRHAERVEGTMVAATQVTVLPEHERHVEARHGCLRRALEVARELA